MVKGRVPDLHLIDLMRCAGLRGKVSRHIVESSRNRMVGECAFHMLTVRGRVSFPLGDVDHRGVTLFPASQVELSHQTIESMAEETIVVQVGVILDPHLDVPPVLHVHLPVAREGHHRELAPVHRPDVVEFVLCWPVEPNGLNLITFWCSRVILLNCANEIIL